MKIEDTSRKPPLPKEAIQAISTGLARPDQLIDFFNFLDSGDRFEATSKEALELYKKCNQNVVGHLVAIHEKLQLTEEEQKLLDRVKNANYPTYERVTFAVELATLSTGGVAHLNSHLSSEDLIIKYIAAHALALSCKHPQALEILFELSANNIAEHISTRAKSALIETYDETMLDEMVTKLTDPTTGLAVKHTILDIIGSTKSEKSMQALIDILNDEGIYLSLALETIHHLGKYKNNIKVLEATLDFLEKYDLDEKLKTMIKNLLQETQIIEGSKFSVVQEEQNIGHIEIVDVERFFKILDFTTWKLGDISTMIIKFNLTFNDQACVPWQGCSYAGLEMLCKAEDINSDGNEIGKSYLLKRGVVKEYPHIGDYLGKFKLVRSG